MGDAIPAVLSAFSGMFVLHFDTSRHAAPLSSHSHRGTHLIVNHFWDTLLSGYRAGLSIATLLGQYQ
jgi:hypothetical protein